nr:hypothetical protein [Tanacetum cinerariifolium]
VSISCGKDVFMLSHEKCIARYALSVDSRVKKALFTFPKAKKSRNIRATSVVAKSRFSIAKTPTTNKVIQLVIWIVNSGCSKHMIGNLKLQRNFVEKFIGTVRFEMITLLQSLDIEVMFKGEDLLTGSLNSNLYTISISDLAASSPVYLMSKATSIKSWLWHRRLSHLNFGTINYLMKKDLVDGIPKFKYDKYDLCSAYEQGKSKKASFPPKLVLNPTVLQAPAQKVQSDNGTEFKNEKLQTFYAKLSIAHITSTVKMPQQNGVVIQRNRTLAKVARTMLIFSKTLEFLWAKLLLLLALLRIALLSLCYPTNDRDDLGKIKLKVDIGIFIGYCKLSIGFHIYNRRTKKIMETIHVQFDELTTMASECNNLGPRFNCLNFQDSLEDSQSIPSKEDLDNLFGPYYEEYYATRTLEVSNDSDANTLPNEDTPSSSSIIVEEDEAL